MLYRDSIREMSDQKLLNAKESQLFFFFILIIYNKDILLTIYDC